MWSPTGDTDEVCLHLGNGIVRNGQTKFLLGYGEVQPQFAPRMETHLPPDVRAHSGMHTPQKAGKRWSIGQNRRVTSFENKWDISFDA